MDPSVVWGVGVLVGALVSGLIGGLIGARKGEGVAGFVWGLFLGPVGWVVVLARKDRRPRCRFCKGVLPAGMPVRCCHCGGALVDAGQGQALKPVDPVEAWEKEQAGLPPLQVPEKYRQR